MKISNIKEAPLLRAYLLINQEKNKKVFKSIQPEISKMSELFGPDFDRKLHLILFNDIDFKDLKGEDLKEAIRQKIKEKENNLVGKMASEGTTPRQLTDLIGSLCDLTSGSGDKGTPVVLVQGYFVNYSQD